MPIPTHPHPTSRITAKERVYHTLREWIVDGTLEPGEKLVDTELCEYFSVSRTPVREAFQLLAAQKLIEIHPGKSTVVTPLDAGNLREWYLPLSCIQGLAAELASLNATQEDLRGLEQLNEAFSAAIRAGDLKAIREGDAAFHRRIMELAGNRYLMEQSELLMLHVQRVEHLYFSLAGGSYRSVAAHQAIIEALRRKDSEQADRLVKNNWLQTLALYEEKLHFE